MAQREAITIGIDMGGTFTKIAICGSGGRLITKGKIPSEGFTDKKFFSRSVKDYCAHLADSCRLSLQNVQAVGVGVPGPVDSDKGVVLSLTNIRGWKNFPLAAFLRPCFGKPVYVDNDANCMALAEQRLGAAKGYRYALCVTLGTGVGGGLILDNKIFRSPFFLGGEVGHIPIAIDGPPCSCGGSGCLERYVGNQAILAMARKIFKKNVTLEEVSRLAAQGNDLAGSLWNKMAGFLGLGLAGIVNTLNPEAVIIGGGVSGAGRALICGVKRELKKRVMKQLKSRIIVRRAVLGNDAGSLGAALMAEEKESHV